MPAPIVLRNLTPAPKKVLNPPTGEPVIATRKDLRDGSRGSGTTTEPSQEGVIFSESFDNQPDWTSGLPENATWRNPDGLPDRVQGVHTGHTMPKDWYAIYQDPRWAPSLGDTDRHEAAEILASNTDKARGGTGKSYVCWRDSRLLDSNPGLWNSDSALLYRLDQADPGGEGFYELYAEFWIAFSPEIIDSFYLNWMGAAKLFRIYSFTGDWNAPFDYFNEVSHPELLWSIYGGTQYGLKNFIALYGVDPPEGAPSMPKAPVGNGDFPLSYMYDTGDPIPDQLNGGLITPDLYDAAMMDQVFGPGGTWNKMAFHIKMNSAPGVNDGVLSQFLNDQRILHQTDVAWCSADREMVPMNVLGISGNDFFNEYPNEDRREEWYAIDDLVVRGSLPEDLK